MHVVVNHIPIRPDADWTDIAARFAAFAARVKPEHPGMRTALLTRASDTEAIFVGIYSDPTTMQRVSSEIAAPWFAENIRQFMSGPAVRSVGEVIAGE